MCLKHEASAAAASRAPAAPTGPLLCGVRDRIRMGEGDGESKPKNAGTITFYLQDD